MEPSRERREQAEAQKSYWGKSKFFGRGQRELLIVSVAGGALSALAVSGLNFVLGNGQQMPVWLVLLAGLPVFPVGFALVWALLVDRETVRNAPQNPEQSVENYWLQKSAETSFYIMLPVLGVSSAVVTYAGWELPAGYLLGCATILMGAVFLVSYQVYKRR